MSFDCSSEICNEEILISLRLRLLFCCTRQLQLVNRTLQLHMFMSIFFTEWSGSASSTEWANGRVGVSNVRNTYFTPRAVIHPLLLFAELHSTNPALMLWNMDNTMPKPFRVQNTAWHTHTHRPLCCALSLFRCNDFTLIWFCPSFLFPSSLPTDSNYIKRD